LSKRILLIGGNFSPEFTGIGKYNGEMIQWLAQNGYECTVITTQPYYPQWKVQEPYTNTSYVKEIIETSGNAITIYRCPQYVPANPSGKKRLIQEFSFTCSSFIRLLGVLGKKKFHYVLAVVPPFQLGLHALLYKKLRGAKFLYHVQDLQIEAARDLQMIKSKSLIKGLFGLEKFVLKQADVVSSISKGMIRKMEAKTGKDVVFLPNWVDMNFFYPLTNRDELKIKAGFADNDILILYSGAIGEKQGLEMILESAARLRDNNNAVKFLICGSGPYKEKLIEQANQRQIHNVHFMPLQPFEQFNAFLNMADVHLVIQKKGASDLVMPSKLTTILAVGGVALVTAEKGSSLYEVVVENNMGVLVEPENEEAFSNALLKIIGDDLSVIRNNARRYAEEHLAIDKVLGKYTEHLN
jgi:colanic acid biosynthesis glycosyl transferase WcaI